MITKKIFIVVPMLIVSSILAICMSNKKPESNIASTRFIYELKYKPNLSSDSLSEVLTILNIVDRKYSIYRDYTVIAQDSILKAQMENMKKPVFLFKWRNL